MRSKFCKTLVKVWSSSALKASFAIPVSSWLPSLVGSLAVSAARWLSPAEPPRGSAGFAPSVLLAGAEDWDGIISIISEIGDS